MDFTLKTYMRLLNALQTQGFFFNSFYKYKKKPSSKTIILRHDIDKLPQNAFRFAQIEHKLGIRGSYYFRAIPESWDEKVISEIAAMRHEVGYHYEDLSFAAAKLKAQGAGHRAQGKELEQEIVKIGIDSFVKNLEKLRKIVSVKTICMHGSPLSKFDNKLLWDKYDYRDYGIIGEPYFDIDFSKVLYLTDTGRRWDGNKVSIRDKVGVSHGKRKKEKGKWEEEIGKGREGAKGRRGEGENGRGVNVDKRQNVNDKSDIDWAPGTQHPAPSTSNLADQYHFHSTFDIIKAAEAGELPDQIMMTFHPQRWTDRPLPWVKELVLQNIKNQIKRYLIIKNK